MDYQHAPDEVTFRIHGHVQPNPRSGHVAAVYRNYMIVWGGYREDNEAWEHYLSPEEVWLYDTSLDTWHVRIVQAGNCPHGTSGAKAVIVEKSLYILCGHCDQGNVNDVYRLDLSKWTWEVISCGEHGPSPRDKFSAWEYQNKIFVFGGFGVMSNGYLRDHGSFYADTSIMWGSPRGWNNQVLVFDPEKQSWTNQICQGAAPSPRAAHASVRIDDTVFTFGGRHDRDRLNDIHFLDLKNFTWSGSLHVRGRQPEGRTWHTLTQISESRLFLYGGFNQQNQPLSDTWTFDIWTYEWTQLHFGHSAPRLWHSACVTMDGDILVFGGCSNNILDPEIPDRHCNDVLKFRCSPSSLFSLSLEVILANREMNCHEWDSLPEILYRLLRQKSGLNSAQASVTVHV